MIKQLAENTGKGLVAGIAGTAVMTISSTIEMKCRGRAESLTPADAAEKVFGIEATSKTSKQRLSTIMHWAYGTTWGVTRGVLGSMGLRGPAASGAHFALVWGAALVMLPALKIAPPVSEWGFEEIALDALHHAIYACAAGTVYDALEDG